MLDLQRDAVLNRQVAQVVEDRPGVVHVGVPADRRPRRGGHDPARDRHARHGVQRGADRAVERIRERVGRDVGRRGVRGPRSRAEEIDVEIPGRVVQRDPLHLEGPVDLGTRSREVAQILDVQFDDVANLEPREAREQLRLDPLRRRTVPIAQGEEPLPDRDVGRLRPIDAAPFELLQSRSAVNRDARLVDEPRAPPWLLTVVAPVDLEVVDQPRHVIGQARVADDVILGERQHRGRVRRQGGHAAQAQLPVGVDRREAAHHGVDLLLEEGLPVLRLLLGKPQRQPLRIVSRVPEIRPDAGEVAELDHRGRDAEMPVRRQRAAGAVDDAGQDCVGELRRRQFEVDHLLDLRALIRRRGRVDRVRLGAGVQRAPGAVRERVRGLVGDRRPNDLVLDLEVDVGPRGAVRPGRAVLDPEEGRGVVDSDRGVGIGAGEAQRRRLGFEDLLALLAGDVRALDLVGAEVELGVVDHLGLEERELGPGEPLEAAIQANGLAAQALQSNELRAERIRHRGIAVDQRERHRSDLGAALVWDDALRGGRDVLQDAVQDDARDARDADMRRAVDRSGVELDHHDEAGAPRGRPIGRREFRVVVFQISRARN